MKYGFKMMDVMDELFLDAIFLDRSSLGNELLLVGGLKFNTAWEEI